MSNNISRTKKWYCSVIFFVPLRSKKLTTKSQELHKVIFDENKKLCDVCG